MDRGGHLPYHQTKDVAGIKAQLSEQPPNVYLEGDSRRENRKLATDS